MVFLEGDLPIIATKNPLFAKSGHVTADRKFRVTENAVLGQLGDRALLAISQRYANIESNPIMKRAISSEKLHPSNRARGVVTTDTLSLNCFEVWLAPYRRACSILEMDQGSLKTTPSLCVLKRHASEVMIRL